MFPFTISNLCARALINTGQVRGAVGQRRLSVKSRGCDRVDVRNTRGGPMFGRNYKSHKALSGGCAFLTPVLISNRGTCGGWVSDFR